MDQSISFETIYKHYKPEVIRYLRKLIDSPEIEDLSQEVFLRINQNFDKFKGNSKFSTWIYRIATNVALDKLRSKTYKQQTRFQLIDEQTLVTKNELESSFSSLSYEIQMADQIIIKNEMSDCVRGQVQKLPLDYRIVMVLSEFEGQPIREIAQILNISVENVKIRLHRGKAKLKALLEKKCDFYYDDNSTLCCDRKNK